MDLNLNLAGMMPGVKRWAPWFLAVLGLCFLVFAGRSTSPTLLQDTDTAVLLSRIQEVGDPLAWFRGDWPLQNHFYRPISTLAFEWDLGRAGTDGAAFGTTNALLACACVLLCFWMMRELTDLPWFAGVSTLLFGLWHLSEDWLRWSSGVLAWGSLLCLLGVIRGGKAKVGVCILAALSCLFFSTQLLPVDAFSGRIVHWLPGRTASVMTVFALAGIAFYARSLRLGSTLRFAAATAQDVPATKSATVTEVRAVWPLVVLASVCTLLALGSYEQAVMLPGLMFGVWLFFRLRGFVAPWWPHLVFWGLLVGYMVLRSQLVPSDVSGYQEQQLRTGPGVWIVIGQYLLPAAYWLYTSVATFGGEFLLLMTGTFWPPLLASAGNVIAYVRAWQERDRWWFFAFLLLSVVAFLPMAWLQPFGHYHYFPSAFRAGFVVILGALVLRLVVSAVSLPVLRAPSRPCPAPGSLPRL